MTCLQGEWPAAVFYHLEHPTPYGYGYKHRMTLAQEGLNIGWGATVLCINVR
jgi:hypothetical protein